MYNKANSRIFNIDFEEVEAISAYLQASEKQVLAAYHRALSRTQVTMLKYSRKVFKDELGVSQLKKAQRRVQAFKVNRRDKTDVGGLRLWNGLNDISVNWLNGRLTSNGRSGATFTSSKLGTHHFDNGFVIEKGGRKQLFERDKGSVRAIQIPVPESIASKLNQDIMDRLTDVFMHHFEVDLKGRVKTGLMKERWSDGHSYHTRGRKR